MSFNIVDKSTSSKLKKIAGMLPGAFQTFNSNHFKNENNTFQLADQVTSKLPHQLSMAVNPSNDKQATLTNSTYIGGSDNWLVDVYCSDGNNYFVNQSVSGNTLIVNFGFSLTGSTVVAEFHK